MARTCRTIGSLAIAGFAAVLFSVAPVGLDYDFTPETKAAFAKGKENSPEWILTEEAQGLRPATEAEQTKMSEWRRGGHPMCSSRRPAAPRWQTATASG